MTDEIADALAEVAFVPQDQALDLSKEEKLRTTALLLAIQYVTATIVKDGAMYQALRAANQEVIPATTPFVLQSAIQFEAFLLGAHRTEKPPTTDGSAT